MVGGGIAVLFHNRGTRSGWVVSSTPRPHFTPVKDPVPIVQEAGRAPGPVWTGGKSRPHRDSIPDRPARSQSLHRLSYRAHKQSSVFINNYTRCSISLGTQQIMMKRSVLTETVQRVHRYDWHSKCRWALNSPSWIFICGGHLKALV